MKTPVALFVFNRPDLTAQVFARIAEEKPKTLLVVADGPRDDRPNDKALCDEVRRIVSSVNWDCEVLTNFSDRNLGCGLRMYTGLEWVFRHVEEAILLEDDCLASPDFFRFCEAMLERYRHDGRVGTIAGNNFLGDLFPCRDSYFFSRYAFIWGWASWRRAFQHYDWTLSRLPEAIAAGVLDDIFEEPAEAAHWQDIFLSMRRNPYHTWDYQLSFALMSQSLLSIIPAANLVTNVGCARADATHTQGENPLADLPWGNLPTPWRHPGSIVRSRKADRMFARHVYGVQPLPEDEVVSEADSALLLPMAAECFHQGRLREVGLLLNPVLRARPKHPEALNLAGVAAFRQGQSIRAFYLMQRAVAANPGTWLVHANFAQACRAVGRTEQARDALIRAIELNPSSTPLHVNLAQVLVQLGDRHRAAAHLREAARLEPSNPDNAQALAELEHSLALS